MKKMSKLILATIMAAGVFSLSGCIENLEPAGISDLRGAKAELLRAQTALQAAEAAKVQAEAALVQAQARVQEAIAKQEEAKVSYVEAEALLMKYQAEAQAVQNEEERARLELLIEQNKVLMQQAQNEAAVAAAELEKQLLEVQAAMLRAQADYEQALKSLALAKSTLTPEQQNQFAALENAVEQARRDVETKTQFYIQAGNALAEATAEADPEKGISIALRQANKALAAAQANLEAATEAEKIAAELLELDETLEGWVKKQEELKDLKKNLEKEAYSAKEANLARKAEIEDSIANIIRPAAIKYSAITGYVYNANTGLFSSVPGTPSESLEISEIYIPAPKDAEGNNVVAAFDLPYSEYTYGNEKVVLDYFDNQLDYYRNYAEGKYLQTEIETREKDLAKYVEGNNYKVASTKYQDALAAYNSGDILAYFKKYAVYSETYDITKDVATYNKALTAFETAIKNYEDAVEEFGGGSTAEAVSALTEKREAAINVAEVAKLKAYQAARTEYDAAKLTFEQAKSAYNNALAARNIAFADGEEEAGATYSEMETYVETTYPAISNPTEDQKAKYNKYKTIYARLKVAKSTFESAKATFVEADNAHTEALEKMNKAIDAADKEYTRAKDAANLEFNNAYNELMASQPTFDDSYRTYLGEQISIAQNDLQNAMNALAYNLEGKYAVSESYESARYYVAKGNPTHEFSVYISGVPDYLRSDTYDTVTNSMVYKVIPASLDDIKDIDVFAENYLNDAAEEFSYIVRTVYGRANNGSTWSYDSENYGRAMDLNDNYPFEMMSYDEFFDSYDDFNFEADDNWYTNYIRQNLAASGYTLDFYSRVSYSLSSPLAYEYQLRHEIDELKAQLANLSLLPDFITLVEQARQAFVQIVELNAASLEVLKTEVEDNAPRMIDELEDIKDANEALDLKVSTVSRQIDAYTTLIESYCGGMSKELFDQLRKTEYESAAYDLFVAENRVIEAQKEVEEVKDGLVDAVTMAQLRLDNAEAELKAATEKLAIASAQLAAAIEAIYGTTM